MSSTTSDETKHHTDVEVSSLGWTKSFKSHLDILETNGIAVKQAGFAFRDLSVCGRQSSLATQADVGSILTAPFRPWEYLNINSRSPRVILDKCDGFLNAGELLLVLGRPGAGCSTFLKTISGQMSGLELMEGSSINYSGISRQDMLREFRGELLYNQETDKHFPHLTVEQTLDFAAKCRTSRTRPAGLSEEDSARFVRDLVISIFGLSGARHTKVGSDLIRGVSGGERRRVTIAEMAIAGAPIGCWDNPTRGLDSGSALAFTQALRNSSDMCRATHVAAIYQASQNIYEIFDKVTLLYEGKQIYFGPASRAKSFFLEMGWECPARQTTSDFLTSLTNPTERRARAGYENKVPRTASEFAALWRASPDYESLQRGLRQYELEFPVGDSSTQEQFKEIRRADRARFNAKDSPYTISITRQIQLCTIRAYQRTWGDRAATITMIVGQFIMALVMGSLFYMQPDGTQGFFTRGGVLFFTITINALLSLNEINGLYAQRPIVEKHASYAFYTPMAEAIASVVADLPVKFLANVAFNLVLYFMADLRQTAAAFFIFFLFNFVATLSMSLIFRNVAESTRTVTQAMVIAGVLIMALIIYSGFTPPVPTMHPWFSWIRYISPVGYAYESLIINEFQNRNFPCSSVVPDYPGFQQNQTDRPYFSCSVQGSVAGQLFVSGDAYIESSFQYSPSHLWRNLGILLGMIVFLCCLLMVIAQYATTAAPPAEVLIFRRQKRGVLQKYEGEGSAAMETDAPSTMETIDIGSQQEFFVWKDVTYDVAVKKETKRLLDGSSGWVKPGSLTALMGVSGAGKTTLLDTLALRTRTGTVSGQIYLGAESVRESQSYQQRIGYVQQQDILTVTATVREALRFSASLRQPRTVSQQEKFQHVESIIRMLDMESFADAVTGEPGLGLNVKQRKLLSIGVELAAKPALLFLDEPTSGLDSQSSWAVVSVLRRLADHGQAILCTVHQPSSTLFEQFDRLLFLAEGGRTAYFGPIGTNSSELISYFEEKGARKCDETENPAEYMIEVASHTKGEQDWPELWKSDARSQQTAEEINQSFEQFRNQEKTSDAAVAYRTTYAMPFWFQLQHVTFRVFQQYWRTPDYVVSKAALGIFASLFISFSFYHVGTSQQDLQNAILSIFMLLVTFTVVVQQIMPQFLDQRTLYEIRERPSRAYSWVVFLTANMFVELCYQVLVAIAVFVCWYYPIFGTHLSSGSQAFILLLVIQFYVFGSSFAHLVSSSLPDAETAGNIAAFLFALTVAFNGVFVPPDALAGFWIFMYRISPLTYITAALAAVGLHGRQVNCGQTEVTKFDAPMNQTCGSYLADYLQTAPGRLLNPQSTGTCEYCPLKSADQFLTSYGVSYGERWRNSGIVWGFIAFNLIMTYGLYYMFRVKVWKKAA